MATLAIISTVASIIGIIGVVTGVAVKGTLAVSAFNSLNDLVDVKDLNNIKGFDEGFTDITIQSMDLLVYMMQYMSKLIILFSFLCIIINSFKLWAGTTEIKKSFIDILYKSVMVILLTFFYPKAVVATYTWATEIGIKASGGSELLTNCFSALAANTSSALQNTTNVFLEKLKTNGGASEGDNYIISEGTLKVFEELGLSEDEAKKWASQNGLTIITGKSNLLTRKQKNAEKAAKKKLTTKETNKRLKQDLEIIRSLNEVLSGIDENGEEIEKLDAVTLMNMNNDSLKSVFFNPYIKGSNDRISISAMMKTAIIISEIVSSGCLGPYGIAGDGNKDSESSMEGFFKGKEHKPRIVLKLVGVLIKFFCYRLAMLIATIIIMCEYVLSFIEFLVVAACSSLLIPMFFLDATKNFVTNIIKTFFSYFIKILVTTMMIFFIMGMYIRVGGQMYGYPLDSSVTILYYLFNIILGVILVKSSGKVAMAVISGSPSLGVGDIAHSLRGMAHAGHVVKNAATSVGNDIKKTTQQVQGAVKSGMNAGSSFKAAHEANKAGKAAYNTHLDSVANKVNKAGGWFRAIDGKKMSDEEINKAWKDERKEAKKQAKLVRNNLRNSTLGQQMKQDLYKAATGMEMQFLDENGHRIGADSNSQSLRVGQKFYDGVTEREATLGDVKRQQEKNMKNSMPVFGTNPISGNEIKEKLTNLHPKVAPGEE